MSTYKDYNVGDRVRHDYGHVGTVTGFSGGWGCYVKWDDENVAIGNGPWNVSIDKIEEPPKSPREELLQEAIKAITQQRNNTYGPPTQDFDRSAGVLNALGYQVNGLPLKPHDIAIIITAVKLSRLMWSPDHKDNWVDVAGYAGCGWECANEANSNE